MDVLLPHEDVGLCKDVAFSDSRIVAIYAAPKKGRPSENNSRIYGIDIRPLRGQIESPEGLLPIAVGEEDEGRRTYGRPNAARNAPKGDAHRKNNSRDKKRETPKMEFPQE